MFQVTSMENNTTRSPQSRDQMIIGLSQVTANAISVIICLFVILIIVTYKKYQFIFQRLLLYLTINLLILSITHVLQGASYKIIREKEKYCQILGYLHVFATLCIEISLIRAVLELYLCMILKKDTTRMKWIYFAAIYLIPAGVPWIPFALGKLGFDGIQCYIKHHDYTGYALILVLDWLPLGAAFITMGPVYWFSIYCIWRQGKQYTPLVEVTRNTIYQQTIKDLGYVKWFPLVFFVIDLFTIIISIISLTDHYYTTLWTLRFVLLGLQNGAIALIGVKHERC